MTAMNYGYGLMTALLLSISGTRAQQPVNPDVLGYIEAFRDAAVLEMQRTGVPASVKLAQAILESEAGKSDLVTRSNNHFGIKCKSSWTGEKVYHDDDEQGECFRKYASAGDSYRDHSDFLRTQPRYAFLFELEPTDYKGWAYGLKKAGYATNPRYPEIVIRYIEQYRLNDVTLLAMSGYEGRQSTDLRDVALSAKGPQEVKIPAIPANPAPPAPITETRSAPVAYPDGEFRINATKVVYASAGTSLLAMAEKHRVRLGLLLDINDLDGQQDILGHDQLIFLQRKRKQGVNDHHIVRPGETLHGIAQEEGIRLESLLEYNNLTRSSNVQTGSMLNLHGASPKGSVMNIFKK
jgi:hypothetical protein